MQAGLKQAALHLLYPPQCLVCGALVTTDFGLCGACWRDTPFISGLVCDQCGQPLQGEDSGKPELCDDCLSTARPWSRGRVPGVISSLRARRVVTPCGPRQTRNLIRIPWISTSSSLAPAVKSPRS